ncbi:hypothetical protein [Streptomyces zingiberis]|uniref:Transmembrane protein n=1 Tax=Streptomyces zingiberis TaxID=2053010 RepID=A0ABX1BZQ7_9ACTN|nr:hypothetical protein [Streptomyces zingiberis]NJQ01940.1 hypothetical protein [Streptomyces zingiberis]
MEAGPRDRPQSLNGPGGLGGGDPAGAGGVPPNGGYGALGDGGDSGGGLDGGGSLGSGDGAEIEGLPATLAPDGPEDTGHLPGGESFREIRPPRRLRVWQLAPIVALGAVGSLMFAFPLAFAFGDGGAVVAMLGLLLSCCAAGWSVMAARRVNLSWPGFPAAGSGGRPDWRVVVLYALVVTAVVVLCLWRVARLR